MSELAKQVITQRQKNGKLAEDLAVDFLLAQGFCIVARNYRQPCGEIDIIAQDINSLVFVEVRYRRPSRFASAAESIDRRKQKKIIRAAEYYLLTNQQLADLPCRFDCILLNDLQISAIEWIKNAFLLNVD